jgi:sarcosine oxidase subunit delta
MMQVPCPHCGPRNEDEFVCWSEFVARPAEPDELSDEQWMDYVYNHTNTKGRVLERWWHGRGCRRWLLLERDTVTHEFFATGNAP